MIAITNFNFFGCDYGFHLTWQALPRYLATSTQDTAVFICMKYKAIGFEAAAF
ncbi:hypothetical protein COO91_06316 [Nostoc flagelliforme CCNUN1]|uniref:Uncharacterized protein n=1 Tax=Nostoc flagelliforme CCNUN1 TaxID=2038116 RepID=A0A2K8SXZ0_9NOSO|nr:hypothetical protein [Nostoc flagelliforme]AUB40307.1 hypothetical protein COO91_06316 [Nostoc flagelliforme CCNUN1]